MSRNILLGAALSIACSGMIHLQVRATDVAAAPSAATQPSAEATNLARELGDDDFHVRQDAAKRLRELGQAALPALKQALNSQDSEVHAKAEELLQEIDRPPALPVPQPKAGGNFVGNSIRISVINGAKSIDATESGRTVHINEDKDGIAMKVAGQIDGKDVTRDYKAQSPDELKKSSPQAFALYQQYSGGNNIGQIQFQRGGGVLNGNARLNIQGGPIVIGPNGIIIQPGANLPIAPGLIQPIPNPNADNLNRLEHRLDEQMKAANLTDAQNDEVKAMIKQLRESQQQGGLVVPGNADAQLDEYNRQCDALRKKLAELKLSDPGEMLPPPAAQRLGITAAEEKFAGDGLTVMHVLPDSRGQKMGLKELDTIQKVNGKKIHSTQDLRKAVTDNPKGLVIEGMRDGQAIKLEEKGE